MEIRIRFGFSYDFCLNVLWISPIASTRVPFGFYVMINRKLLNFFSYSISPQLVNGEKNYKVVLFNNVLRNYKLES